MNKWSFLRVMGLVVAIVLVVFGGIENVWRTVKFAGKKFLKN